MAPTATPENKISRKDRQELAGEIPPLGRFAPSVGMTGKREAPPPTVIPTECPPTTVLPTECPPTTVIPTERSERRNLTDSTTAGSTTAPNATNAVVPFICTLSRTVRVFIIRPLFASFAREMSSFRAAAITPPLNRRRPPLANHPARQTIPETQVSRKERKDRQDEKIKTPVFPLRSLRLCERNVFFPRRCTNAADRSNRADTGVRPYRPL